MEAEIIRRGWPVGEVLGSEAELVERFDVSRAVFREAVRIVESHHVARMRRGPNGGLLVTAPNIRAVQASAALFLDYKGVTPSDLLEVRTALELTCVRDLIARLDEKIIGRLRQSVAHESILVEQQGLTAHGGDIHRLIAEMSGNSALWLFVEVIMGLLRRRSAGTVPNAPRLATDMHHAHSHVVGAIIAGDVGLAQHRMTQHLRAILPLYD